MLTTFPVQLTLHTLTACLALLVGLSGQFTGGPAWLSPLVLGLLPLGVLAGAVASSWSRLEGRQPNDRPDRTISGPERPAQQLARHDALTGLPTYGVFLERLSALISGTRRSDRAVAVLCVDLADFESINEGLGHSAGDLLIRHTSARLLSKLRDTDTLVRLAADEFAIIQTDVHGPESAAKLCERLLAITDEPYDLLGHGVLAGANIGVAVHPTDGSRSEQLLQRAREALRRARAEGPRAFRFFDEAMDRELRKRKALEQDLHRALERSQLEIEYQPQIDITTRRMVGVEALLRWHHPERGRIPPDHFIPLAEDNGLILPIGTWVLEQACAQAVAWQQAGAGDLRVAVNLSPVQFRHPDLVGLISEVLERVGLAPRHLELEITERVLLEPTGDNLDSLRRLKAFGVGISIDDFGVGHSSLSYLRRFPFDEIKVDRSFFGDLAHDPSATAIVRAALSFGRSLGLNAVAEGVESAEQLALLNAEGCRVAQGYYFSPPVSPREIDAMIGASSITSEHTTSLHERSLSA